MEEEKEKEKKKKEKDVRLQFICHLHNELHGP
jgi:hypothetical protein